MRFYNSIKKFIAGMNIQCGTDTNPVAQLRSALSRARSYLINSLNMSNALLSIFSSADWMIADQAIYDNAPDEWTDIDFKGIDQDADATDLVHDSFSEIGRFFKEFGTEESSGLTPIYRFIGTLPSGSVFVFKYKEEWTEGADLADRVSVFTEDERGNKAQLFEWHSYLDATSTDDAYFHAKSKIIDTKGRSYCFWDFLGSQAENNQLMDNILTVTDSISSMEVLNPGDMLGLVNDMLMSSFTSVRDFGRQLITASTNGLEGVAKFILQFFKSMTTARDDGDGYMAFTDNTGLIPAQYWQGVFAGITEAISSVVQIAATVIATSGQIVIGALGFVLSTALQIVGKVTNIDPSNTYPSFVYYGRNLVSLFPYAIAKQTRSSNSSETVIFRSETDKDAAGHYGITVPGGSLFVGYTADGGIISEFHPDLIDRRRVLASLITLVSNTEFEYDYVHKSFDYFLSMINNPPYIDTDLHLENDSTGHISQNSGELIEICCANIALYVIYTNYILGIYGSNPAFKLDHTTTWFGQGHVTHYAYRRNSVAPAAETRVDTSTILATSARSNVCLLYAYGVYFSLVHDEQIPAIPHGSRPKVTNWTELAQAVAFGDQGLREDVEIISGMRVTYGLNTSIPIDWGYGNRHYYGLPEIMANNLTYAVKPPIYDATSFWASITIGAVLGVIAVVTAVALAFTVKKALRQHKMKNALKVEQAYQKALKQPTTANIAAYDKVVRRNNLFASIFGGTKYSREGLWGSVDQSDSGVSHFKSKLQEFLSTDKEKTTTTEDMILKVLHSIVGDSTLPSSNPN